MMNGHAQLFVLYQVSNDKSDTGSFNAFQMRKDGAGVSLASVKRHCEALKMLNYAGVDGFHWRVRMDDKAANSREPSYSWWDIQDENARLPTKDNMTLSQLQDMFKTPSPPSSSSSIVSGANKASGAIRSLGKAMNAVTNTVEGQMRRDERDDMSQPRFSVIAFKLLDLSKVQDKYSWKTLEPNHQNHLSSSRQPKASHVSPRKQIPKARPPQSATTKPTAPIPPRRPTPSHSTTQIRQPPKPQQPQKIPVAPRPAPPKQEPSLMDFVTSTPSSTNTAHVSPYASQPTRPTMSPLEPPKTRAEKLKQEYEQKRRTQNKVWDDVDQRWVEVDPQAELSKKGKKPSSSEPPLPPSNTQSKKIVGISIDASNAIGKSSHVQAAVQNRVQEMEMAKQKAIQALKEREAKVKSDADAEDEVRKRLEPKIKAWSEEHGKKKQLRALLSSLHMILWKDSGWKPVSLGDILEEKKARRCYLKATLKVHPDKTRELDAEKRFIAKRVFDALSQAMTVFENSS